MARSVALAIDLGASGGRVVSGAFDGRLLELEEIHRFENGPVSMGGELVWDLVRLWQEVVTGLRAAAVRHGHAVRSVGVDTWGVDFSFLTADGGLLANPVCYRDARTQGMLAAAEAIVPYPPGVPALAPGDRCTEEALAWVVAVAGAGGRVVCADPGLATIRVVVE